MIQSFISYTWTHLNFFSKKEKRNPPEIPQRCEFVYVFNETIMEVKRTNYKEKNTMEHF